MANKTSYGGGYEAGYDRSSTSAYGSGYSGYGTGTSRLRGANMSGYDQTQIDNTYCETTNFAADVTYPGAGNFFGQQTGYN